MTAAVRPQEVAENDGICGLDAGFERFEKGGQLRSPSGEVEFDFDSGPFLRQLLRNTFLVTCLRLVSAYVD